MSDRKINVLQLVFSGLSMIAAVFGVIFVSAQVSFAKQQYKADKLESLRAEWVSPTMLYYRAMAARSYPDEGPHVIEVLVFFERVARARDTGIVSVDDVAYYFQDELLAYACGYQEWVRQNRILAREDPDKGELWRGFTKLAEDLRRQKRVTCPSPGDIQNVMRIERIRYVAMHVVPPPPKDKAEIDALLTESGRR